jgi:uncharacterized protein (TIGR02246 family)
MSSERDAVVATFEATSKAWADGDASAFAAWYADDATVLLPGFYLRGKGDIDASMAAAFAGPLKGSRRVHSVQSMRFLTPDTAIVVTRSATLFPGKDEAPAERRDLATWVLTRRDFQWFVEAYHSCPAS